ncbi:MULTISPECIES: hypothetical protein [Streptomyces]|uniref:DNA-binding protein n=1 Tax=Streptomyces dengpaensis TaxID=2049881 RepID=A0ABN5HXD0_9ACTN|nr:MULTISPECIES: hypothetical protein [Streptomyces]AVH55785.1 hypothetical protein C4B68_08400 [Streptomyces dengpaensis]PIB12041.1 hypothetical protein B1C81_02335 [Streptomyces sp. HG99]
MRLIEVSVLRSAQPPALWCILTTRPEAAAQSRTPEGPERRDARPSEGPASRDTSTPGGPERRDTRMPGGPERRDAWPSDGPAPRDTSQSEQPERQHARQPENPLFSTGAVLAPAPAAPQTSAGPLPPGQGPARRLATQLLERAQTDDAPTARWYLLAEPEGAVRPEALAGLRESLRRALTAHGCHRDVVRAVAFAGDDLTVLCSSRHRLAPGRSVPWQLPDYYPQLLERIGQLANQGLPAPSITRRLQDEGFTQAPGREERISLPTVQRLLHEDLSVPLPTRYRRGPAEGEEPGPDEWWLRDLAIELSMPTITLYTWIRRGWVPSARKETRPPYRWIVRADRDGIAALRARRYRNSA